MTTRYRGSCQCGGIEFEIGAEPLTVYVCHCVACKKQSGASYGMAMVVAADAVKVVRGEPKIYVKKAESGRTADCAFCPECGNRLFHWLGPGVPIVMVKTGVIDNAEGMKPAAHLWTQQKDAWVDVPEDVLAYAQQPTDQFAAAIERYRQHASRGEAPGSVSTAQS